MHRVSSQIRSLTSWDQYLGPHSASGCAEQHLGQYWPNWSPLHGNIVQQSLEYILPTLWFFLEMTVLLDNNTFVRKSALFGIPLGLSHAVGGSTFVPGWRRWRHHYCELLHSYCELIMNCSTLVMNCSSPHRFRSLSKNSALHCLLGESCHKYTDGRQHRSIEIRANFVCILVRTCNHFLSPIFGC